MLFVLFYTNVSWRSPLFGFAPHYLRHVLHRYFAILVPPHLGQHLSVKGVKVAKFEADAVRITKVNSVSAHTRHQRKVLLRRHIYLFYLIVPKGVVAQEVAQSHQLLLCKGARYAARGHHQVGRVALRVHDVSVFVDIVIIAIVGHHAQQRQALLYEHIQHPARRLVALHRVNKGVAAECLLYGSPVHLVHLASHGVQPRVAQLLGRDKARVRAVGHRKVHLPARCGVGMRAKIDKGKTQIDYDAHQEYEFDKRLHRNMLLRVVAAPTHRGCALCAPLLVFEYLLNLRHIIHRITGAEHYQHIKVVRLDKGGNVLLLYQMLLYARTQIIVNNLARNARYGFLACRINLCQYHLVQQR